MKSINRIQITGEIITDNPERILQEMIFFYQALYSLVKSNDVNRYFESTAEPQIINLLGRYKNILLNCYKYSYEKGHLSITQKLMSHS